MTDRHEVADIKSLLGATRIVEIDVYKVTTEFEVSAKEFPQITKDDIWARAWTGGGEWNSTLPSVWYENFNMTRSDLRPRSFENMPPMAYQNCLLTA